MTTKLVSRTIVDLTPEHVREAQAAPEIPGERPKKAKRLEQIANWIDSGDFCRADFAYAVCKADGKRYRVNGNHTSTVLLQCLDNPAEFPQFPTGIRLTIEEWECDCLEEIPEIFDTYDNPVSLRSSDDKLGIYIAQHPDMVAINRDAVKAALRGVNFRRKLLDDHDYPPAKVREVGTLLVDPEIRRYCVFVADLIGSVYDGWKRQGINAAIYESWLDDPETAGVIWEETLGESDPDAMSQSRLFVTKMRTWEAKTGKPQDYFYRQFVTYYRAAKKTLSS